MPGTVKGETIPVLVTVGELLFANQREEMATGGSPLALSAGGRGVHKEIVIPTTPGCIH